MLPGEATHKAGEDGARRAKLWLESTTRVKTVWLNTDGRHAARMTFKWPHTPHPFSYDIGGLLHGGDFDGDNFLAECKAYTNNNNHQPEEYRSYLAKCYVVESERPGYYNHFMWITWHPFSITDWSALLTPEYIRRGVISERQRVFGIDDEAIARSRIDSETVDRISTQLWMIVLSNRQESLVITPKNRALVYGLAAKEGTL